MVKLQKKEIAQPIEDDIESIDDNDLD